MPLVSIVLPAFNAAQTIRCSIQSVLAQRFTDWELLIVNDCSTDHTATLCSELAVVDSRISLLSTPANGGVARARNLGIEASRGRYIAFLDSDDQWLPDKLSTQFADSSATPPFSYMGYRHGTINAQDGKWIIPPATASYQTLLAGNPIGTLTVALARDLLGDFRFPVRGHEDFALWLTLLKQVPCAIRAGGERPYAVYTKNASSLSATKWRALHWVWKIYREQEHFSALRAARHTAAHALRGIEKHYL